jgi:cytochrome c peroxidase
MWLGVRANHAVAVRAGIRNSLFTVQPESVAVAIGEYLASLAPMPSPYLVHGKRSAAAQRGETLFRSEKVGCSSCHPAPLFTDLKFHDVGTRSRLDQIKDQFDTPTLLELWRTAPYLHDGSGNSIRELLTTRNHGNRHGTTSHLKPQEIDDLAEYVLSL